MHLRNADHPSLEAALVTVVDTWGPVQRAALSVAAVIPRDQDRITLTNRNWSFSRSALARRLGLNTLKVCNDYVALALALPGLAQRDRYWLQTGVLRPDSPQVVIGPGTGLGVGILLADGSGGWVPVPGEGGHVTLAARTDREAAVIRQVRRQYRHVSAERLVSGPGLVCLHGALRSLAGSPVDGDQPDPSAEAVTRAAREGDPLAAEALQLFFLFLATTASNLAITLGAFGGVNLAGGIIPQLLPELRESEFLNRFNDKGRYRSYLSTMPVGVITHPQPAFPGLIRLLHDD